MIVQAEATLYPLGQAEVARPILEFVNCLEGEGIQVEPGPMGTLAVGEVGAVFAALRLAYEASCREGRRGLVIKLINEG